MAEIEWLGWPQRGRLEARERPGNKVTLYWGQDVRWICQEHRARLGREPRDMAKNKARK